MQIQGQENKVNSDFAGMAELHGDMPQGVASLSNPESALNGVAFSRLFSFHAALFSIEGQILGRSTQLRAVKTDATVFAVLQVVRVRNGLSAKMRAG